MCLDVCVESCVPSFRAVRTTSGLISKTVERTEHPRHTENFTIEESS